MALTINTNIKNDVDGYLLDAKNIKGTYVVVENYSDLANLPSATVVIGSLAYVSNDNDFWQYKGSNSGWEQILINTSYQITVSANALDPTQTYTFTIDTDDILSIVNGSKRLMLMFSSSPIAFITPDWILETTTYQSNIIGIIDNKQYIISLVIDGTLSLNNATLSFQELQGSSSVVGEGKSYIYTLKFSSNNTYEFEYENNGATQTDTATLPMVWGITFESKDIVNRFNDVIDDFNTTSGASISHITNKNEIVNTIKQMISIMILGNTNTFVFESLLGKMITYLANGEEQTSDEVYLNSLNKIYRVFGTTKGYVEDQHLENRQLANVPISMAYGLLRGFIDASTNDLVILNIEETDNYNYLCLKDDYELELINETPIVGGGGGASQPLYVHNITMKYQDPSNDYIQGNITFKFFDTDGTPYTSLNSNLKSKLFEKGFTSASNTLQASGTYTSNDVGAVYGASYSLSGSTLTEIQRIYSVRNYIGVYVEENNNGYDFYALSTYNAFHSVASGDNITFSTSNESYITFNDVVEEVEVSSSNGISTMMIETTYSNFVNSIGSLIPGMKYRITDFVTKINGVYDLSILGQTGMSLPYATSAEHPFDLIIEAISESEYNENVKATLHAGDTYFAHNDLSAWELKWTHLNDRTKYSFADNVNGKGIITYMKDEFNNEAYYDFKNVMNLQFGLKRIDDTINKGQDFDYDSSGNRYGGLFKVFMLLQSQNMNDNLTFDCPELNGTPGVMLIVAISDVSKATLDSPMDWTTMLLVLSQMMETTVTLSMLATLLETTEQVLSAMTERQVIETFMNGKFYYTFDCMNQDLSNYIDFSELVNPIATVGGGWCHDNKIGHCSDALTTFLNSLGETITIIPHGLNIITFENNLDTEFNTFGNIFEANCFLNVYGGNCYSNKTKDYFYGNTFGNNCYSNSFGNYCYSNSFGNDCYSNSFGNDCDSNSFGNNCYSNSFGNNCDSNSFGNNCYSNSFGNYCYSNSFGNSCGYNEIIHDYYTLNNIFENGVSSIILTSNVVGNNTNLQNIKISQGVKGSGITSASKLTITATTGLSYQVVYKAYGSNEVIVNN